MCKTLLFGLCMLCQESWYSSILCTKACSLAFTCYGRDVVGYVQGLAFLPVHGMLGSWYPSRLSAGLSCLACTWFVRGIVFLRAKCKTSLFGQYRFSEVERLKDKAMCRT